MDDCRLKYIESGDGVHFFECQVHGDTHSFKEFDKEDLHKYIDEELVISVNGRYMVYVGNVTREMQLARNN